MIQKTWTDKRIWKFCKKHKFSLIFKENKTGAASAPVYEVTKYKNSEHSDIKKILEWCKVNCIYRYELGQWHLGYENNVFFKFSSREDYTEFYRFYDKTFLPRIDVEVR
jgi:hypothetical protein